MTYLNYSHPEDASLPLIDRLQPVPAGSGFRMEGYWVWGGSVLRVDGTYHLFASRWPKDGPFPEGYRRHSEIVRATAQTLTGPYTFQEVVIGKRDPAFWDLGMAHNPTIQRTGEGYILFYIGSDSVTTQPNGRDLLRRVGFATAPHITGPWQRNAQPVISQESNNPAVLIGDDGSVRLLFRDTQLRVYAASAPAFSGPYTIQNDNVWPACPLEDFALFENEAGVHCICEDNVGGVSGQTRWGVHLISPDGMRTWRKFDPVVAYDHDIRLTGGGTLHCTRRERPQLLVEDGKITGLLTAVYDGNDLWCQPVAVEPGYE